MKPSLFLLLLALCTPLASPAQSFLDIPVTTSSNPDRTITVQWTGGTTHLYDIEWSADLDTWATSVKDYPTVAGSGIWTDTGDFFFSGPKSRFGDETPGRRFYRIRQGRELPTTLPTVTLSVFAQDTTAGTITFEATPTAPSGQAIDRVWLNIDGRKIGDAVYEAPWRITIDTRTLPNGTHNAYAVAEDTRGGNETTSDDTGDQGSGSGIASSTGVSFTSDNLISEAYYRPWQLIEETETQQQRFFARIAEPRDWTVSIINALTSAVVRTYTGTGTVVEVLWDGKDALGNTVIDGRYTVSLDVAAEASMAMTASPEEPGAAPASAFMSNVFISEELSEVDALLWQLLTEIYAVTDYSDTAEVNTVAEEPLAVSFSGEQGGAPIVAMSSSTGGGSSISWPSIKGSLGTFGVMYQGHHPAKFSSSWQSPRRLGVLASQRVRFAGQAAGYAGPWGPLRSAEDSGLGFHITLMQGGYAPFFHYKDDEVTFSRLSKTGDNSFNMANIGFLIGHSVSANDAEYGVAQLPVPQVYYPIYNASTDTYEWLGTVNMEFGSAQLRWLGFYTCSFFRASEYNSDSSYEVLKYNGALPLNGNLSVFCGFATEVTIVPSFGEIWAAAMMGKHGPANSSVANAWGYATRVTQSKINGGGNNVARVVCWLDTRNDRIYGYGAQASVPGPTANPRDVIEVDFQVP